jgi:hypothetical protein
VYAYFDTSTSKYIVLDSIQNNGSSGGSIYGTYNWTNSTITVESVTGQNVDISIGTVVPVANSIPITIPSGNIVQVPGGGTVLKATAVFQNQNCP